MKTQKIESMIWGIIGLFMLIITVLHPRIIYLVLLIVCFVCGVISLRSTRRKTVKKICLNALGNVIGILIACYIGQFLNIFFPYHASYEYKKDITTLKEDALQEYYYFPDEIPEKASKVKWMCVPSFMQGSDYHKLFFFTDESYIQEIYNTFSEEAIIYTYNQYAWINNDTQKMATFPGDSAIDENERKDVEVFMLYDNNDINHLHNGGFYINQTEGYICFFAQ